MNATTIGSLFSGYGGLDMGVKEVTGGRVSWVSDVEPGPAHHRRGGRHHHMPPSRPDAAASATPKFKENKND